MNKVIPTGWLISVLATFLGLSQILLWRFLDIMPLWAYAVAVLFLAAMLWTIVRSSPGTAGGPTIRILLTCLLVSLILFALGGEGRFFYSNIDWQVRDAVLRDMAINPWPFVYTARPVPDVLRAPLGMFFVPALAFKLLGPRTADLTLLVQNATMLAIILSLGSQLFKTSRQRLAALTIVLFFSGLDIVGQMMMRGHLVEHLEFWSGLQYSSTITLAFWVPQHALAGWIGAIAFLLWREGRISLGVMLAILPLTALWSPLALMGALPFAALAVGTDLWHRKVAVGDILLPALSAVLVIPTLLYLGAANSDVGIRPFHPGLLRWAVFEALEVLPFLVPVALAAFRNRADLPPVTVIAICLLIAPFVQIGWSIDFMMRASIPALAILSVFVAKRLFQPVGDRSDTMRVWLIGALILGSATGLSEITRAFMQPPSPRGACTFFKAWDQSFGNFPKGSYLAPLPEMPVLVRPTAPYRASAKEPRQCWYGDWSRPSGLG